MSVSVFKITSAIAIIAASAVVIAGGPPATALKNVAGANAAQPTPVVSVTTLPQMPGAPTGTPATQAPPQATFPPVALPPDTAGRAVIQVDGDVSNPLSLTLKDLEKMSHTSLTLRLRDPDGRQRVHTFTGALLSDIIQQSHPRFSSDSATLMRKYVYVTGINGATAIVGFPEFAADFNGKVAILAYLVDFKNLPTPGFAELVIAEDATRTRFLSVARLTVGEPGH